MKSHIKDMIVRAWHECRERDLPYDCLIIPSDRMDEFTDWIVGNLQNRLTYPPTVFGLTVTCSSNIRPDEVVLHSASAPFMKRIREAE